MVSDEYSPRVTVRRLGDRDHFYQRERILIVVQVAFLDYEAREAFFSDMAGESDVGIAIDPLTHPRLIFIRSEESDEGCGYRGRFIRLDRANGAFSIFAPAGLVDLMFDEGANEVEYALALDDDGSFDPVIELPEGRSLLSLFSFDQHRMAATVALNAASRPAVAADGSTKSEVAAAIA